MTLDDFATQYYFPVTKANVRENTIPTVIQINKINKAKLQTCCGTVYIENLQ